jgi:predicted DNA-binding helix-hairpin-helix protein
LLRVPGFGPETVKKIIMMRREKKISGLEALGIKGKRLEQAKGYVIFE